MWNPLVIIFLLVGEFLFAGLTLYGEEGIEFGIVPILVSAAGVGLGLCSYGALSLLQQRTKHPAMKSRVMWISLCVVALFFIGPLLEIALWPPINLFFGWTFMAIAVLRGKVFADESDVCQEK